MRRLVLATAALLAASAPIMPAADEFRTERVGFAPGASSATIEGRITGRQGVDYVLGARAGQYADIEMTTDNTAAYFNIIAPGETDVALFNSSSSGSNQYDGKLPATGDYKVRVYLFRAAARRGETANYRLHIAIETVGGTAARPEAEAPDVPAAPESLAGCADNDPRTPASIQNAEHAVHAIP